FGYSRHAGLRPASRAEGAKEAQLSDSMRPGHSPLDPRTEQQPPAAGSVGAVPGVEAQAQDSSVLEQQLIEQGGWYELIELLLNRSERVQSAERVEILRQ